MDEWKPSTIFTFLGLEKIHRLSRIRTSVPSVQAQYRGYISGFEPHIVQ